MVESGVLTDSVIGNYGGVAGRSDLELWGCG
jgi:hypothetical protein